MIDARLELLVVSLHVHGPRNLDYRAFDAAMLVTQGLAELLADGRIALSEKGHQLALSSLPAHPLMRSMV